MQYEQEPFNDEDVLCEPDGDDEENLYYEKILQDMEDPLISDKSYVDNMEDYFGFH